jgi:hypothetical protein
MQWVRTICNKIHKAFIVDLSRHDMATDEPVRAPKLVKVEVVENVPISDSVGAKKGVYYELADPVDIPGNKGNGGGIELRFDNADKDKLLLTLKTGKFVFHKRPREFVNGKIGQILNSIGQTTISNTLVNLNISDNAIQSRLNNDSLVNQQLAHFANGIKAFDDLNFNEAVKEFYQVIEDSTPSHLVKYRSLRNGLSHAELDSLTTINELQYHFGIVCKENAFSTRTPKSKYVDISDPEVQVIIEREANYLRTEVLKHIDMKVGIKTD